MSRPIKFGRISIAVDWLLMELGNDIRMATPLGLGKPNQVVNEIYHRVKNDPKRSLKIFTALSLAVPVAANDLQRRFLGPFLERQWGKDYPHLAYIKDLEARRLPANIKVHEFYLQAGKSLTRPEVQRDYVSVNYTHAPYAIFDRDINLLVQMVAADPSRPGFYSLSCNPDLTLDVVDVYKKAGRDLKVVAMVHPDLPYCGSDAEVPESFFTAVIESEEVTHKIYALPRQPIGDGDFMIGLYASMLIEDGGTLQIGIGSLSDALVYCTLLRHNNTAAYVAMTSKLLATRHFARNHEKFFIEPFREGLYGTSELVTDGFMHLRRGGVLKREVFDLDKEVRRYLHGAFFVGSNEFYNWIRGLKNDSGFCMTRVSKVNDLYDENELAIRRQRVKARFFNSTMNVTLLGAAASDTTEEGLVVSGVGGQYNFVAMSHELPDSYSSLMLRASRHSRHGLQSNFVWGQGQLTIPRHLRDVVISEFGVAFLKNRTDEEVIQAQLTIANSSFQEQLRSIAVENSKLSPDWVLPEWSLKNTESWPSEFLAEFKADGLFPAFPFGSDFTPEEECLAVALTKLKAASHSKLDLALIFWRGLKTPVGEFRSLLERMDLLGGGIVVRVYKTLLLGVLSR